VILRIPKYMVRKGMYIESVECSDLEFSERRFLLETDSVLNSILVSSAENVLINRTKSKVDCSFAEFPQSDEHVQLKSPSEPDERARVQHSVSQATAMLRDGFDGIKSGRFDIDQFEPAARNIVAALRASPLYCLRLPG